MIVYDLACICGITFEGWFQDRGAFLSQQESGLLVCPGCGSNAVRKILSPVNVCRSQVAIPVQTKTTETEDGCVTAESVLQALSTLRKFVEKNFEDVGTKLAEESLKIHYGVEKPRNIRGVTSEEEEKVLAKEGIELLKLPLLVKDDTLN